MLDKAPLFHFPAAVAILALLLVACGGSPPPTVTETSKPPTIELNHRTPILTQSLGEEERTATAPPPVGNQLLTPMPPVVVRVSPEPPPTPKQIRQDPTSTPWPTPLPTPVLATMSPTLLPPPTRTADPTPPVPLGPPQWTMNYETGKPQALLLTQLGVEPVRGIFVDCNTVDRGEPWLALRMVGEQVIPSPPSFRAQITITIDGEEETTEWLLHPDNFGEDFQRVYPAKEVGTNIISDLLDGALLMEVSVADLRYTFDTHGFAEGAAPLIDFCQFGAAVTPTPASTPRPTETPPPTPTTSPPPTLEPPPTAATIPTPEAEIRAASTGLPTVTAHCSPPPCNTRVAPRSGHVDWIEPPRITASGEFSLVVRVHEGHDLVVATPAPNGGRLNLIFSDGPDLYGHILPVDNTPGYRWKEKPGAWVADVYDYEEKVLTVVAQMGPDAAVHEGLRICLWTGGYSREETYILDCQHVEQP